MSTRWIVALLCSVLFASSPIILAAEQPASRPAASDNSTLLPVPAEITKDMPPARTREELSQILSPAAKDGTTRPLHIVLVAGPKDHGPGEHDYPAWQKAWERLLAKAPQTKVTTAWEKPSADDLKSADVLVLFKHTAWPKELNSDMKAFLARGGGIVLLHFAVDCANNPEAGEIIGLYWGAGAKFRHGWLDLDLKNDKNAPFLRGLAGKKLRFHDETYWALTGSQSGLDILATAVEKEEKGEVTIPMLWNKQIGKGRVHVNILGHYNWTFNDPLCRLLIFRGIAWAAGEPLNRFDDVLMSDVSLKP